MNINLPQTKNYVILATIIGVCFIIGATIFGMYLYNSRERDNTIKVVGFASKKFDSDIVKWHITLNRNAGLNDVSKGYMQIETDRLTLIELLKANGIAQEDINTQPVNANPTYSQNGTVSGYSVQQTIFLISNNVVAIEKLSLNPTELFAKGIVIQSSSLEYFSSKLSEMKRELLAAATDDAQGRAEEIAKKVGTKIEKMTSARAGVFQIKEPFSNEVSDYGIYNTSTKQKEITVTVNAAFSLRE